MLLSRQELDVLKMRKNFTKATFTKGSTTVEDIDTTSSLNNQSTLYLREEELKGNSSFAKMMRKSKLLNC